MRRSEPIATAGGQSLTTREYWDRGWSRARAGRTRAKRIGRLASLDRRMARLLADCTFQARSTGAPPRILEVGCANSIWLPYLGRETGSEVVGVDFSHRGCELAEQNLAAMDVVGTIVCSDFFEFARRARRSFDVVMSFGLVEHFSDVTGVLSTMTGLLRPGGVLFATVPNLAGVYGPFQRMIDDAVYRQHVILKPEALAEHARRARLVEVESGYVGGPLRLSVLNFGHLRWLPSMLARVVARGLFELDCALALLPAIGREDHPSTAAYVYVRGRSSQPAPSA